MLKDLMTHKIDKLEFFIAIEKNTGLMLKKAESYNNNSPQRLWLHSSETEARKAIAATTKGDVTFRRHLCRFEVSKIGTCSVDNAWQPSEEDLAAEDWAIFEFLV